MKKQNLLTRMLLLFALIVGSTSVWADDTYVKVTSASDLTVGETYIFVAKSADDYYLASGDYSKRLAAVKVGFSVSADESVVTVSSASAFEVVLGGTNGAYTLKMSDDKYLGKGSSNTEFASNASTTSSINQYTWTYNSTDNALYSNYYDTGNKGKDHRDRYIGLNASTPAIGPYNDSDTYPMAVLYKKGSVEKIDPTITFNNGSVRVGKTLDLSTLFTSNSLGAVTYSITAGDSYASCDGSVLTGVAEGSVTVQASQAAAGKYNAKSVTATITVNPALVLSSIAVTTAPDKTSYFVGDMFDATGMVVTATYTDATQEDVTASCTLTPTTALTIENTEITISYTENAVEKTTTQPITVNPISDYVILPFNWEGGGKAALVDINGITTSSLDDDYAAGNAPYLVKFNGDGKYITIKTGSQPGKIYVDIKKIGGALTSTLKIQESSDGESFTDVEELYTFGANNAVVDLETTKPFNEDSRYVRIYFLKKYNNETGSNVGVGPITITSVEGVTITDAKWASFSSTKALDFSNTGITAYIATQNNTNSVHYEEVTSVPANTGLILYSDVNESTTINVPIAVSATLNETNLLQSTASSAHIVTAEEAATDRYYVFGKIGSEVGFVKGAANYEIGTGKAYLVLPSGGAKDFIGLPGNEAEETEVTGITEVEKIKKAENGIVYNLAGQRVSNPIKGLYIINGKKVIIK